MKSETSVTIVIDGVRVERLDRLKTVVKSYLATYGRKVTVTAPVEKQKRSRKAA